MIQKLWEMGKTVVVPKMQGKKLLICHYTPTTELATNHWGIKEPKNAKIIENQEIDIVLVPMLICDKNGNRIGYGGGFYDRFLAQLPNSTKFIGINFFEPTVHIPIHEFDVPLHGLITHEGIFEFRQNADS